MVNKMSENNSEKKPKNKFKKHKKNKIKCSQCEFYDDQFDYCCRKEIEDCTMQHNVNFSSCEDFLVKEELVFF